MRAMRKIFVLSRPTTIHATIEQFCQHLSLIVMGKNNTTLQVKRNLLGLSSSRLGTLIVSSLSSCSSVRPRLSFQTISARKIILHGYVYLSRQKDSKTKSRKKNFWVPPLLVKGDVYSRVYLLVWDIIR